MTDARATLAGSRVRPGAGILITAALILMHGLWFALDERGPFSDQFRYYEQALHLRGDALAAAHPSHPPLYPALAALVPGRSFHALRWLNLGLALATFWLTHVFARRHLEKAPALTAAVLAVAAPLTVSVQHLFYIETLLLPLVLATWILLPDGERPASGLRMLGLGLIMGLGLLAKWTWPLFTMPALLLALRNAPLRSWMYAFATAAAVSAPWYISHFEDITSFVSTGVLGGAGHISALTGSEGWLHYPKALGGSWWGMAFVLAAAGGACILLRRDARRGLELSSGILLPLAVFACVPTKKVRHLLPILPLLSVFAVVGVLRITTARTRTSVLCILSAAALSAAAGTSFLATETCATRVFGMPLAMRPHGDDPGPPQSASPLLPLVPEIAASVPPGSCVLIAFHLPELRDTDFNASMLADMNPRRFPLIALALPAPESARRFPLHAAPGDEGTAGILEATHILLRSGRIWLRVQSRFPVHRHAAALQEAILDPDGFARGSGVMTSFLADDNTTLELWTRREGRATEQSLYRLALREDPDHERAWTALDGIVPPPGLRARRLVDLGLWPVAALDLDATDPQRRSAAAGALLRHHSHLTALLQRIAAMDDPVHAAAAGRLLQLRDDYYTRASESGNIAKLVAEHHSLGDQRAVLRWIHRALAGRVIEDREARVLLAQVGESAGQSTRLALLTLLAERVRSAPAPR